MSNAARVLPETPGERDDDLFPLRERLRFRDNLGLGLRDVRRRPAFAGLPRGPWHVFIAIACFWQANPEAWPSQETIAHFGGYTSRSVRDYVEILERAGVVRLRRERRENGTERIYYAPGLVTLIELAAFVERFPRGPMKAHSAHPPEAISGGPPEMVSGEHRDKDLEPSSWRGASSLAGVEVDVGGAEEEEPTVTREDREVAREALAERMRRKFPRRAAPRWYDRADVEMVARCSATIEGDRDEKLRAHHAAILGAFCVSKDGPPTSRFIWGTLAHFRDHIERGRVRASVEAREAARRAAIAPPLIAGASMAASPANEASLASDRGARRQRPLTRDELATKRREFEELAATTAAPFREYVEAMAARYRDLEARAQ